MGVPAILAALADETRRRILLKLKEGKISSGDLAGALGMTPSGAVLPSEKVEAGRIDLRDQVQEFYLL